MYRNRQRKRLERYEKSSETLGFRGFLVGVTGFEPAASTSQMSRATNCATPRYAIKLWSCKWSNMWSGTNLTAFLIFTNCPKSAPLKGFRRFFFSGTEWEIYAPKAGALPPALHLDMFISTFIFYSCFLPCFVRPLAVPVISSAQ